ncbi:MAG: ABC transporter ATP-binding protein [Rhodopirellula sp.]|nr:ABC transporter ATP-binding protein [Rhodopirellula sp.]
MSASSNPTPPLCVENLTKRFRQGNLSIDALKDVTLTIQRGEFVAVMGASGSGKSTLLHVMAGLMPPTSGSVHVGGENIAEMSDSRKTKFRRKNIGVIFQQFNLIPTLTAEENILLPAQLERGTPVSGSRLDELLDLLEIKNRRTHRPDALSGGEQQRVAIGRALLVNPAIILADEPTGNLDSTNSTTICTLLRKLCTEQNRTLVVVTHDKDVADYGDRTIHLRDGRTEG